MGFEPGDILRRKLDGKRRRADHRQRWSGRLILLAVVVLAGYSPYAAADSAASEGWLFTAGLTFNAQLAAFSTDSTVAGIERQGTYPDSKFAAEGVFGVDYERGGMPLIEITFNALRRVFPVSGQAVRTGAWVYAGYPNVPFSVDQTRTNNDTAAFTSRVSGAVFTAPPLAILATVGYSYERSRLSGGDSHGWEYPPAGAGGAVPMMTGATAPTFVRDTTYHVGYVGVTLLTRPFDRLELSASAAYLPEYIVFSNDDLVNTYRTNGQGFANGVAASIGARLRLKSVSRATVPSVLSESGDGNAAANEAVVRRRTAVPYVAFLVGASYAGIATTTTEDWYGSGDPAMPNGSRATGTPFDMNGYRLTAGISTGIRF